MGDTAKQHSALEHAKWRARFMRSLLDTHRALPFRANAWREKDRELLEQLTLAETELQRLMTGHSVDR
jgi:hypothetical protein